MPGAYAHITLVNLITDLPVEETPGFGAEAMKALKRHLPFRELGAVSPDYPYLDIVHKEASKWADLMHYEKTGDMLKAGVPLIQKMEGEDKAKAFAWLMGYAAHVAMDVTIHPVVELKVGRYQENKGGHRKCEMHQDAHIFQRLNVGEVGLSEHLNSGIWACCNKPNSGKLDLIIADTWKKMLQTCYASQYSATPPQVDQWHSSFKNVVDKAEEGNCLPPFARHVAVNCGLTYPAVSDIDPQYILNLKTPNGIMNYDDIFDRAMNNALKVWSLLALGIFENDSRYLSEIGNWDLDTGKDSNKKFAFWENA